MQVRNPYDDAIVETIPDHSTDDVIAVIEQAYALRKDFAQMPAHEKASILVRAADLIQERSDEFAESIVCARVGSPCVTRVVRSADAPKL